MKSFHSSSENIYIAIYVDIVFFICYTMYRKGVEVVNERELHNFLKENRKSFPNYFRVGELKNYHKNGQLKTIAHDKKTVGFYVLENEKLKSLFLLKNYRKMGIVEKTIKSLLKKENYITIAINKKSVRMIKFANKYNFKETEKEVKGKTYNLTVYEYRS